MNTDQPTNNAVAALEEIAKCLPYPNGALSFVNARLLLAHIRKLEADNAELVKTGKLVLRGLKGARESFRTAIARVDGK